MKTYETKLTISKSYFRPSRVQIIPPMGCPDIFPGKPDPAYPCTPGLLKTEVFQYTTISDGAKYEYTSQDAEPQFSTSVILDPNAVSIVNLFINGMLQSPNLYTVQKDHLTLSGTPTRGVPIILQFIKIMTSS